MYIVLPSFEGVALMSSFQAVHTHVYILKSIRKSCPCPSCGKSSSRVHSRYTRVVQDLAIQQTSIHLQLQVKKFFCDSPACSTQIFTERFAWLQSYQRKTNRLQELLQKIVLSANCTTASKVTESLGVHASHDTLLRLLYKIEPPTQQNLLNIGIDDFAFKKRNRYGTLIIDQDTNRPITILESRTKEDVVKWLKQHPNIQVVSRDGSTSYASAISEALPHAQQVADRWHILKGLFDALKESLNQYVPADWKKIEYMQSDEPIPVVRKTDSLRESHEKRVWKRSQQVQELFQQGKKIAWIARSMKLSRGTVYTDLQRKQKPDLRRSSILNSFLSSIQKWNTEEKTVDEMEELLREMGYKGSRSTLNTCVAQIRREQGLGKTTLKVSRTHLLRSIWGETEYEEWKNRIPEIFRTEFPKLQKVHRMIQDFLSIVREKRAESLVNWLITYKNMPFPAIQKFMNYVEKDIKAITVACSLAFSNGITEGHINRLKTIKRMMYGRASSKLLTQRVLITF
ncbi:ISL3 family transposase [Bacillus cereus]